jgi:uncharacterized protein YutD
MRKETNTQKSSKMALHANGKLKGEYLLFNLSKFSEEFCSSNPIYFRFRSINKEEQRKVDERERERESTDGLSKGRDRKS